MHNQLNICSWCDITESTVITSSWIQKWGIKSRIKECYFCLLLPRKRWPEKGVTFYDLKSTKSVLYPWMCSHKSVLLIWGVFWSFFWSSEKKRMPDVEDLLIWEVIRYSYWELKLNEFRIRMQMKIYMRAINLRKT